MSAKAKKYLIARVRMPAGESLDAFAARLNRLVSGFIFEEEMTGRYEEVPAFVAQRDGMEFVLLGIPAGEPDDGGYVLEFDCETNLPIDALLARGGFIGEFVSEKPVENDVFLDFSEELAQTLVRHGIEGCKPIRPVDQ